METRIGSALLVGCLASVASCDPDGNVVARPQGLVSYWKLDESEGEIAYDSIGPNPGVVYGARWSTGICHGALQFDGLNDYVDVGNHESLRSSTEMTLEAWVKVDAVARSGFINKHRQNVNEDRSWTLRTAGDIHPAYDDSKAYLGVHGSTAQIKLYLDGQLETNPSTSSVEAGIWHHIAATARSTDGTLLGDNDLPLGFGYLELGYSDGLPRLFFAGVLDEVKIYNRVLSDEEIRQGANQECGPSGGPAGGAGGDGSGGCANIAGVWRTTPHGSGDTLPIAICARQSECSVEGDTRSPESCVEECGYSSPRFEGTVSGNRFVFQVLESPWVDCDDCALLCYEDEEGELTVNGERMYGHVKANDCEGFPADVAMIDLTRATAGICSKADLEYDVR